MIVRDGSLALIERRRDDRRHYVFPGGGVELGETAERAATREACEELGLCVAVGACIAELVVGDTRQRFFLAAPSGGTLGAGRDAEMMGEYPPARHLCGTYKVEGFLRTGEIWVPARARHLWHAAPIAWQEGSPLSVNEYRARGTYRAVWLPLAALPEVTVYPRAVAARSRRECRGGWPAAPLRLREPAP